MKNKTTLTVFVVFVLMLLPGCSEKFQVVKFSTPLKHAFDFKKFNKIFLSGLTIDSSITSPDPKIQIINFFTQEFAKTIKKKIDYFEVEESAPDRMQVIKEKLKDFPDSLLITGTFKTEIKTRSIIKETKSESKKLKTFVKIEFWEMALDIEYFDTNSFRSLDKKTFKENLKDADPEKKAFNFKSLFDKITDKFIFESQKKVKIQERYLLKK